MINKYIKLCICILIFFSKLHSQDIISKINFDSSLNKIKLELNKYILLNKNDSISIETIKFYISNIKLAIDDSIIFQEPNSYHLIDFENISTKSISLNYHKNIIFNKIKFNLGIDSATNVSGALGGDLDPTKGMYWTWQNGYINFKFEGKSNICQNKNNEFQYHLGGYLYPNNSIQEITLNIKNNKDLNININLDNLLPNLNLSDKNHIMSPSLESVKVSKIIANSFEIK
ncbi:MAG: hypothetical protein NTW25_13685 [Candidatus Kapabacteria bacterium]|nr:hypothetical protein [Candidatus Kapabacteria bacterium]